MSNEMDIVMKIALTLALAALPVAAFAHAYPQTSSPAAGALVHMPPTEIAIDFDDALEPAFSTITVTDAKGAHVEDGAATLAPGNARHLSVALKPLTAGAYRVEWRVTDTDTHKTQGHYGFTVAP